MPPTPPPVSAPLTELLQTLEAANQAHDAAEVDHHRKRRNLERPTAQLVQLLLLSGRRRRVLEVGTSTGYSSLWIAAALQQIPAARPLVTIERDRARADEARRNFASAGLADWIDLRVGDATGIIADLADLTDPFDAVFFDADRVSAPAQLALLAPRLAPDALLMADNALSHPDEMQGYLDAVSRLPGFVGAIIPVGKGLHVAHRLARG